MPQRYLEIIDDPNGGFTLRAKVKHGPGELHTVQLSPEDVHALQMASRRQINRLASAGTPRNAELGCHSKTSGAFEGEEDERGVQGWGYGRYSPPLDVQGWRYGRYSAPLGMSGCGDDMGRFSLRKLARGIGRGAATMMMPVTAALDTAQAPLLLTQGRKGRKKLFGSTKKLGRFIGTGRFR